MTIQCQLIMQCNPIATCQTVNLKMVWDAIELSFICHLISKIQKESGKVKHYLREHCNGTFSALQENLPKALESVSVETIRKWEHHMIC
ncbi:hypothetical protein BDQ17DRAFT_1498468 [Cyathus striatus]|nr:hypothetical protein BDQ17DRAFT_1498468 [Cyathus striatus]